jgi:hypothetical protein
MKLPNLRVMASPPSLSSYGLPSTFSHRPQSNPPSNPYSTRGRGQSSRGNRSRGRGHGGNRGSPRGGYTYDGRSSQGNRGGYTSGHGDMRTGLFKESFLEDPWKDLVGRKSPQGGMQSWQLHTVAGQRAGDVNVLAKKDEGDGEGGMLDGEGEIVLPDDDDDLDVPEGPVVGLGDGLVEAVRKVT